MADGQSQYGSLLTLRSFPRFKKDRWEEFKDIVTPEQPYTLLWRQAVACEKHQNPSLVPSSRTCSPRGCTEQVRSNSDSASLLWAEKFSVSGETVLWAYPNDIAPLAVGHVLLDLCPSPQGLSRKVRLEIENDEGTGYFRQEDGWGNEHAHGEKPERYDETVEGGVLGANLLQEHTPTGRAAGLKTRDTDHHSYACRRHNSSQGRSQSASAPWLNQHLKQQFQIPPDKDGRAGESGNARFVVTVGEDIDFPLPSPPKCWQARAVLTAMDAFIEAEGLWDTTGCFHRAGVYNMQQGKLMKRAEDIGRHNCVDRLAGWSVLEGIPLSDKVLLISARMTSSLCAKAIRAGFPVIVSRSAVTTAAIAMAKEAHVTLLGFARTQEERFTVFNQGRCAICHEEE